MLNRKGQKWLYSIVTLNDAGSYTVAGQKFVRARPTKVTRERVRRALDGLRGFHITDSWEKPELLLPQDLVDEPKEVESDSEPEEDLEPVDEPEVRVPKLVKSVKVKKVKKVKKSRKGDEKDE